MSLNLKVNGLIVLNMELHLYLPCCHQEEPEYRQFHPE